MRMRVSAVALNIEFGELDGNVTRIRDVLGATGECGSHLIVFPELATSGYVFGDAGEARALSMRADDPRLTSLSDHVPPDAVVVIGFCEVDGDDLFNSALVIGRGGIFGCYRKAHLWDAEKNVFSVGGEAGAVFDTPIGRVGVAICYDNEFPELPRRLALLGADVLALPVCWPLVARPDREHAPETVQAMASARSSRLATVIADRHGTERDVEWTGGTAVVSEHGWVCATPDEHGVATAVLELTQGKSIGAHNDLFGDRRPELYGDIVFRHGEVPQPTRSTIEKRGIHV